MPILLCFIKRWRHEIIKLSQMKQRLTVQSTTCYGELLDIWNVKQSLYLHIGYDRVSFAHLYTGQLLAVSETLFCLVALGLLHRDPFLHLPVTRRFDS